MQYFLSLQILRSTTEENYVESKPNVNLYNPALAMVIR